MLLSPYPWPVTASGKLVTFKYFTDNTFARDTRNFVSYLTNEKAIPSEWSADNCEDTYPNDAPAMVPDTGENTTTQVGLWVAQHAPVHANGATCFP